MKNILTLSFLPKLLSFMKSSTINFIKSCPFLLIKRLTSVLSESWARYFLIIFAWELIWFEVNINSTSLHPSKLGYALLYQFVIETESNLSLNTAMNFLLRLSPASFTVLICSCILMNSEWFSPIFVLSK